MASGRRSTTEKYILEERYVEEFGLPNGRIPLEKTIIQVMLYLLRPGQPGKQKSSNDAARILSYSLVEHWHFCNVYTIKVQHVQERVNTLYNEFKNNIQTRTHRQHDAWKIRMREFNRRINSKLFDISAKDATRIKTLEK